MCVFMYTCVLYKYKKIFSKYTLCACIYIYINTVNVTQHTFLDAINRLTECRHTQTHTRIHFPL